MFILILFSFLVFSLFLKLLFILIHFFLYNFWLIFLPLFSISFYSHSSLILVCISCIILQHILHLIPFHFLFTVYSHPLPILLFNITCFILVYAFSFPLISFYFYSNLLRVLLLVFSTSCIPPRRCPPSQVPGRTQTSAR